MEATEGNAGNTGKPTFAVPASVLSNRIFVFLTTPEIVNCLLVSREWREAGDEDVLWKALCMRLWAGKANMSFAYPGCKKKSVFGRVRLTDKCVDELSIRVMREILQERRQDYRFFIEKSEYFRAVLSTMPAHVEGWRIRYDSKWKASYVYSRFDSKRNRISKHELTTFDWTMVFRMDDTKRAAKFKADSTFQLEAAENSMHWRFVREFDSSGAKLRSIQVDHYPALRVSRAKNWSWILENDYVIFQSQHYGI